MRFIKYVPKVTNNTKTQYVTIDKDDMLWLQSELIRWLSVMGELDGNRNIDLKQVMRYWWYKRTNSYPKSKNGQNSPLTMVAGLVNNLMFGTQKDLSVTTLQAIEDISNQMVLLEDAIKDLNITDEMIVKLLEGDLGDANAASVLLETLINSSDKIIFTAKKKVVDTLDEVYKKIKSSEFQMQKELKKK